MIVSVSLSAFEIRLNQRNPFPFDLAKCVLADDFTIRSFSILNSVLIFSSLNHQFARLGCDVRRHTHTNIY